MTQLIQNVPKQKSNSISMEWREYNIETNVREREREVSPKTDVECP